MSGTTMNPMMMGAMAGAPMMGGANMTPDQLQQMRQMMFAQALMRQPQQSQTSSWGAMNQALSPLIGAAMMPGGVGSNLGSSYSGIGNWLGGSGQYYNQPGLASPADANALLGYNQGQ